MELLDYGITQRGEHEFHPFSGLGADFIHVVQRDGQVLGEAVQHVSGHLPLGLGKVALGSHHSVEDL